MALVDINWNPSAKELRVFAVLQLLFFTVVAWLMTRQLPAVPTAQGILAVSAAAALVGLLKPAWLRPLYVVWMAAVFPIGFVVSHLLMAGVYYLVITPIGLMMRLCGRDPLRRTIDRQAETYWQPRNRPDGTRGYFRQY